MTFPLIGDVHVEVYKGGEWKFVKLFWSKKDAENWLKGGVPSYKFIK